ncbi:MAG: metallophosphoesterase [Roseiarcus sp.]
MQTTVRWLHLSDFHVGMDNYGQRKLFEQICGHVKETVASGAIPDLVFLTGDLANRGANTEYAEFFESMLAPLLDALGGPLWAGKILAVPGNHDVERTRLSYFERDAILESHGQAFDPTENGNSVREQFHPRFKNYSDWDTTHSPCRWIEAPQGTYRIDCNIRGREVCVVGINTAWLCKDDHDRHKLTPGVHLLDEALGQVNPLELKIVLGHHPMDWLEDSHAQRMRVILGKHSTIYLHGHLHENDVRYDDGGQGAFLAIRCGAAFQGRPDDKVKWVNGLLWGEVDFEDQLVNLRPMQWSSKDHEWKLSQDAFPNKYFRNTHWAFALPGASQSPESGGGGPTTVAPPAVGRRVGASPPPGWTLVNAQFLQKLQNRMQGETNDRILQFYDGSQPTWPIALSPTVPRRRVVEQLFERFRDIQDAVKPLVVNIVGPSGEGKSTAFLQTVARLVTENGWVALWRHSYLESIDAATLQRFAREHPKVLVAVDEAHSLAGNFASIVSRLGGLSTPHFLLAANTLDWSAEVREMHKINLSSDYQQIAVRGINELDAQLIVEAWSRLGKDGMRELVNLDTKAAADALVQAARNEEADLNEGALFGAMLKLRFGDKLRDRIRSILYKLKELSDAGPYPLDAYTAIAAMHAEGLRFLSMPVLAEYFGQSIRDLNKNIVRKLADETIVSGGGRFLICRHKAIATVSLEILRETNLFGDVDSVYADLAGAAISARRKGEYIPDLGKWNYDLPDMFMRTDRTLIAITSAERMHFAAQSDLKMRVKLSSLYRRVEEYEKAVNLFRDHDELLSRSAWNEWSLAERGMHNLSRSVILSAISCCDLSDTPPPDRAEVISHVGNLKQGLFELYKQDEKPVYLSGVVAGSKIVAAFLGRSQSGGSSKDDALEAAQGAGTPEVADSECIATLRAAVEHVLMSGELASISKGRVSRETALNFETLGARFARLIPAPSRPDSTAAGISKRA